MRKWFVHLLIILSLLLAGCGEEPVHPTATPAETSTPVTTEAIAESSAPAETTLSAESEVPTTETHTEIPTKPAATAASLPYLQRIDRADQSIYEGPGYDYVFWGTVRERGTYTIVEEAWDHEGNLWGKLKSGVGWVNLTEIRAEDSAATLISANYADENLILHGAYHYCPGDGQEYCIPIAIRAYGKLRNVELCAFDFEGDDFIMGEAFFTLSDMDEEMPLVAELAFPGDMSMYGIRFVDENGVTYIYSICISGRNGALVLSEYEP